MYSPMVRACRKDGITTAGAVMLDAFFRCCHQGQPLVGSCKASASFTRRKPMGDNSERRVNLNPTMECARGEQVAVATASIAAAKSIVQADGLPSTNLWQCLSCHDALG